MNMDNYFIVVHYSARQATPNERTKIATYTKTIDKFEDYSDIWEEAITTWEGHYNSGGCYSFHIHLYHQDPGNFSMMYLADHLREMPVKPVRIINPIEETSDDF